MEARDVVMVILGVLGAAVTLGSVLWRLASQVTRMQAQIESMAALVLELRGMLRDQSVHDLRIKRLEDELLSVRARVHDLADDLGVVKGAVVQGRVDLIR